MKQHSEHINYADLRQTCHHSTLRCWHRCRRPYASPYPSTAGAGAGVASSSSHRRAHGLSDPPRMQYAHDHIIIVASAPDGLPPPPPPPPLISRETTIPLCRCCCGTLVGSQIIRRSKRARVNSPQPLESTAPLSLLFVVVVMVAAGVFSELAAVGIRGREPIGLLLSVLHVHIHIARCVRIDELKWIAATGNRKGHHWHRLKMEERANQLSLMMMMGASAGEYVNDVEAES